jgi:hypothetical protein
MKKFLFLALMFSAILSTTTYAQAGGDQAAMLQQMKEKQKPGLIEKAGLTDAQADKVIEINLELRMAMMSGDLRSLNEAERTKKMAEFKAAKEKRYSEIPLTAEQIKAVYAYYEDMGRNMQRKPAN